MRRPKQGAKARRDTIYVRRRCVWRKRRARAEPRRIHRGGTSEAACEDDMRAFLCESFSCSSLASSFSKYARAASSLFWEGGGEERRVRVLARLLGFRHVHMLVLVTKTLVAPVAKSLSQSRGSFASRSTQTGNQAGPAGFTTKAKRGGMGRWAFACGEEEQQMIARSGRGAEDPICWGDVKIRLGRPPPFWSPGTAAFQAGLGAGSCSSKAKQSIDRPAGPVTQMNRLTKVFNRQPYGNRRHVNIERRERTRERRESPIN